MTPPFSKTELSKLRYRLDQMGATQQMVADATGASQSQVSRILAGKSIRASKTATLMHAYAYGGSLAKREVRHSQIEKVALSLWNGSDEHAAALIKAFHGLRALAQSSQRAS